MIQNECLHDGEERFIKLRESDGVDVKRVFGPTKIVVVRREFLI